MTQKIPARYLLASPRDVPKQIMESFKKCPGTRKGIYIHGGVGSGKTHVAWALYVASHDALDKKAMLWNTTELLREIRLDFDRHPSDKRRVEEEVFNYRGILIVDDIGSEKLSDWVAEQFYSIINHRYNEMLPTIFTSNLAIGDLADRIGDRTVSRIVEMCDIIRLEGEDRRLQK